MVCFNINGGGGGAKKQDNPHADANARPEEVLLGRTFYAGEEPLAQRGSMQTWNGALLPGDPGANAVAITPTGESRHIPAGCYLNKDVHIRPVSSSVLTVAPTEEGKTYTPAANTFYNSVVVSPIQTMNLQVVPGTIPVVSTPSSGYYYSKVTVLGVEIHTDTWELNAGNSGAFSFSFRPAKILLSCINPTNNCIVCASYGFGNDKTVLYTDGEGRLKKNSNAASFEIDDTGFSYSFDVDGELIGTYFFVVSGY